jgi:hypothetical protein
MKRGDTTQHSSTFHRHFGVIGLLVCLVALIGWGGLLAMQAPYRSGKSSVSQIILPEQRIALMHQIRESKTRASVINWTDAMAFDLDSGELWKPQSERLAVLIHLGDDGTAHWIAETGDVAVWDVDHPRDVRWVVTDLRTVRTLKSVPHKLETLGDRAIMRERFLLTTRAGSVEVTDSEASRPTPRDYWLSNPSRAIMKVGDSGEFIVYGMNGPPGQPLELLHIADDGDVESITSWRAMPVPANAFYASPGFSGGEIATIGVKADRIEIRSAADGSLVRTVVLPVTHAPTRMKWRFSEDLLVCLDNKTLKILDWRKGVALPNITDSDQHWRHTGPLIAVRGGDGNRRVIDFRTGDTVGQFRSRHAMDYFDREHAVTSSQGFGWTITEFDLASGKVSRRWRPFAYVVPSLIGWLLAFFAWSVSWMLLSARLALWAWIDSLLIGGVAFGLLTFRAVISGDTLDDARHVYQYTQGIAMAGAAVVVLWLVFGRTRVTLRVLPPIALCALVASLLAVFFRDQPTTAWHAVGSTLIPVLLLSVWLVTLRLMKWQIVRVDEEGRQRGQRRYPMRDLFWITLLMSAGFAPLRLIAEHADGLPNLDSMAWPLVISQIVGLAAIVGSLSRYRWIFIPCAVLVVSALVYFAADSVARFASDRLYLSYLLLRSSVPQRILMTFPVAVFVMLLPYRLRGWRLRFL